MSARVFLLPDLGEGLTDAEVVQWRVRVGDEVCVDQVVVEVETAKAAVEVPCPFAGRVEVLHAAEGERLPVGRPLLTVVPSATAPDADPPVGDPFAVHREEERAGSGNVLIGYGTGAGPVAGPGRSGRAARRRRAGSAPAVPVAVPLAAVAPVTGPAPLTVRRVPEPVSPRFVSPVVRRLAAGRGLEAAELRGSGPGGVIVRADVEAASGSAPSTSPTSPTSPEDPDGELRIPLRGVRRATADLLARSRREIPEVTVWVDVDATGLLEARAVLAAAHPDRPVGVLALLARITVHALGRFPELNSRVDGDEIVQSRRVDLGVAAQTDRGLVVPVLRDASSLDLLGLADGLAGLTGRARAGNLSPSDLSGGTFTLNNYGVFGVDGSTPIINHPQAAILGIGRIVDKPWVVEGALAVRKVAQLALAFDHRVCDGAVAGGFLRLVADCVERPTLLLATL